jgi:hypothetical protein
MIHGWFMVDRLWHGRDGISTPESGMADPISRSDLGLELVSSAALVGDGGIADSIGTTDMPPLTMAGTTPGATHFITAAALPEAVAFVPAAIVAGHRPGLSTEIPGLREDTLNLAARAVFARVHLAITGMARRQEASPHAVAPVLAAERAGVEVVDVAAAEAEDMVAVGAGNQSVVTFRTACQISKWREIICAQQS